MPFIHYENSLSSDNNLYQVLKRNVPAIYTPKEKRSSDRVSCHTGAKPEVAEDVGEQLFDGRLDALAVATSHRAAAAYSVIKYLL